MRERGGRIMERREERQKRQAERQDKEKKEIIISPSGQVEAEWILSHAISHLYANSHY